jgi:hypothetical protein
MRIYSVQRYTSVTLNGDSGYELQTVATREMVVVVGREMGKWRREAWLGSWSSSTCWSLTENNPNILRGSDKADQTKDLEETECA